MDSGDVKAKDIKQFKEHFYMTHYPTNAAYWQQGFIDMRFVAGDQSLYSLVYGDNNYYQARRFFFNLIRRHRNMITGFQRRNRKSTITLPTLQDDALADDYNAVIRWCEDRDGFQEYLSQGFGGGVDTGLSLLHMYPDYTFDPVSGDLFTDQVAFCNFLIDSNWRKMDFSDCNGIWRRRWTTMIAAEALIPGYAEELRKMRPSGLKDGRFPLQAELLNIDQSNLFPFDEFHYRTTREAVMIIDPYTSEGVEWEQEEDDPDDMMEQTLAQQPWLIVKKQQIPTVKLSISLGSREVYDGPNLLGIDEYPMVPCVTYHAPDLQSYSWRVQGIVRGLRDAQYLYNMRKVIELDILQSQVNSGWIYKVDALTDVKALRQKGQGFLIPLKASDKPISEQIQRIDAPALPQSLLELSQSLSEDITKISGVNEELLGAATDDKAGILSMLRQSAGLTTLNEIFDKIDYTQRLYGKIRLKAIRKKFKKGKIRNILGREPHPKFFTANALKYDIAVDEGNYSVTQRQTELQQLLYFRELGIPIANKTIVRSAIITNKKQVIADMEEEQQAQMQAQQQEAQSKMLVDQSKVRAAHAKAEMDRASAMEKLANINQINADSEHKRAQADLDLVKVMVELEDMDLENYRKSLELAMIIKQQNQPTQIGMETI